jgi:histidine triad (HIT) family protein
MLNIDPATIRMPSVFSKIISGDLPCHKVAESENCLAFLDIHPIAKGHTLVIIKREIDYLFDVEDNLYTDLWLFSKKVAHAMKRAVPCERIGVAVVGTEVPHAHIHLVPIHCIGDLNFNNPKLQFSQEEFERVATLISSYCG